MYYSSIGLISLIVVVIINFNALKKPKDDSNEAKRRYRHFLYGVIIYLISDILWGTLYEKRWLIPVYTDTMLFFISMAFSVLLWTRVMSRLI